MIEIARHIRDEAEQKLDVAFDAESYPDGQEVGTQTEKTAVAESCCSTTASGQSCC